MAENDNKNLKTLFHEPMKTYSVYDGIGRLTEYYQARANTEDGDPCLLTEYAYVDPTSSRIEKTCESNATWDSSWDI
jgi:hypothetical protein